MRRACKGVVLAAFAGLAFCGAAVPADAGAPGQQRFFWNERFANRWGSGTAMTERFLVRWCRRDAQTICPGAAAGIDNHRQCMTGNFERLSLGCQTAIQMVRERGLRRTASLVRAN